jgi:uncharacterized protein
MQTELLACLDNRILNLFILPTEKCNFRCSYCYEDYKIGKMKRPTINGIKALIKHRIEDGLKLLDISWFGGEPLLGYEIVEEISEFSTNLSFNYSDFEYKASMTTNGYFLKTDKWRKLCDLGIKSFQISLDGDEHTHNKTRHLASGDATFHTIWNNLIDFHNSNIVAEVILRIHFSPENYMMLGSLIDKVNKELSGDKRFKVYFKSIERLGGSNDASISTFDVLQKTEISDSLYKQIDLDKFIVDLNTYICYASRANSFVIRANGDIAKCTVAFNDQRNQVGYLNEDGSMKINNEHFRLWLTGLETGNRETLACPYHNFKKL